MYIKVQRHDEKCILISIFLADPWQGELDQAISNTMSIKKPATRGEIQTKARLYEQMDLERSMHKMQIFDSQYASTPAHTTGTKTFIFCFTKHPSSSFTRIACPQYKTKKRVLK